MVSIESTIAICLIINSHTQNNIKVVSRTKKLTGFDLTAAFK